MLHSLIWSTWYKNSIKSCYITKRLISIRECIQKFPDWPPGAKTANGTARCHQVELYRYFVSQSSEFCRHNPLCCLSTSNTKGKLIFLYRISPETSGYTFVHFMTHIMPQSAKRGLLTSPYRVLLHSENNGYSQNSALLWNTKQGAVDNLDLRERKWREAGKDCIMRSFITCTSHKILLG
jgi:hypothetical protein